tara:strand:- start:1799 stop:2017 length:219 start_codon:yes stop_codon:yes gene_type:complete
MALKGDQSKIDKNNDGKISGEDFDIIKKEKKITKKVAGGAAIKGMGAVVGGDGLQDEELIPGKSMDYYKDIV